MKSDEELPRELVWEGAHVSDLGLSAIADGETALVGAGAVEHADACEWCGGRLGRLALLAEAVGHAVTQGRAASVSSRAPARPMPKPWRALGVGTAVAVLAGLPALGQLGSLADFVAVFFARGVPVIARGGFALATSEAVTSALPAATLGASALLVGMGLMIAKARSRSVEGSTP
ncbi:MAG TPA: hypothetical protein VGL81_14075 [Polyangiaceae bacterium]|jgi:hypothetical protein